MSAPATTEVCEGCAPHPRHAGRCWAAPAGTCRCSLRVKAKVSQ